MTRALDRGYHHRKMSWSVALSILANLFPLAGVLFLGWDIAAVLFLYWAESAVIGFYNVVKMLTAKSGLVPSQKAFFVGFFMVHYGLFMFVHLVFLTVILSKGLSVPGFGLQTFAVIRTGLLMLFLSHGSAFFLQYLGKGEYRTASEKLLLIQPYGRIVIMHLTIVFGTAIFWISGRRLSLLVLLVLMKIVADVGAQLILKPRAVVAV
ncbi:MAG: hypothetical protein A2V76_02625 [Candidatus Aminicenantes bacterium RBG_16_63_14]|nr:MAG: hypothetical protein A2V76_02625 [Candidatus Aminicenantes bacterium RBG_16_63_14]